MNEQLNGSNVKRCVALFAEAILEKGHAIGYNFTGISIASPSHQARNLCRFDLPIGCSLLYLAEASLSRRWSRTPALCSRIESRDFTCRVLTTPPRFLAMCFFALLTELGILGCFWGFSGVGQVRYFPLFLSVHHFSRCAAIEVLREGPTSDRVGWWGAAAIARAIDWGSFPG